MSNYLLGFPNKKERDDFLIAIVVILLFMWLFWYMLMGRERPNLNNIVPPVVVELDSDNDGIKDAKDRCPNLAGIEANKGCPSDIDKDGIYDTNDNCPELAGVESNNGCPRDSDGDGVYDVNDKCPNVNYNSSTGCPPDSDGDGVFDADDRCPNEIGKVENDGCPLSIKETKMLLDIQASVEFETGKNILKSDSKVKLDQLVDLMRKHSTLKMSIEGHTDSTGNPAKNLDLSKKRAQACKDYLISKGISAHRLKSSGFGHKRPISTNNTAAGRSKNRRVEFNRY